MATTTPVAGVPVTGQEKEARDQGPPEDAQPCVQRDLHI